MVYGELGRYPIDIDIKVRTISYWARLLSGKQAKFSNNHEYTVFASHYYRPCMWHEKYGILPVRKFKKWRFLL
jgi:hypothetical protein